MRDLKGKTAVITGAMGHIGGAIASRLLREGVTVYAHGRSADGAKKVAAELAAATGGHLPTAMG